MKNAVFILTLLAFLLAGCYTQTEDQVSAELGPEIGATIGSRKYSFNANRVVQRGTDPPIAIFRGLLKSDDFPQKPSTHFSFETKLSECKVMAGENGHYFLIVPMIAQ